MLMVYSVCAGSAVGLPYLPLTVLASAMRRVLNCEASRFDSGPVHFAVADFTASVARLTAWTRALAQAAPSS